MQPGKSVKIKGKGTALPLDVAHEPDPVDVRLKVGDRLFCMRFGGKTRFSTGKRFFARNAPALRKCPISPAEQ